MGRGVGGEGQERVYHTGMSSDTETPTFCTGLKIGHTSRFRAFWPVPGTPNGKEKSLFFFFSFVIFEFCKGKMVTYLYYLFS